MATRRSKQKRTIRPTQTHAAAGIELYYPQDGYLECSKCKLARGAPRMRHLSRLPKLEAVDTADCWRRCPDEGPDRDMEFVNPQDPTSYWSRRIFDDGTKDVRLCARVVIRETLKRPDGSFAFRIGPALSRQELALEWTATELERSGRTVSDPDLELLWPLRYTADRIADRLQRTSSGMWYLPGSNKVEYSTWWNKILTEAGRRDPRDLEFWFSTLEEMSSRGHSFVKRDARRRDASVYVPIDLRRNLDEQWTDVRARLRLWQKYMLRISNRRRTSTPDVEVIARNLYCYYLSTREGLSASTIAARVFAGEDRQSATRKVRAILSKTKKELASAGIIDPYNP